MCSICPRCHPPVSEPVHGVEFGPYSPILPVPLDQDEDPSLPRRWEYPVGGSICSCPPDSE